ncbi:MAG: hypothetical protein QGG64_04945 [Candidatus Latescibacteria bacterium]|nr:hypothetical protein [Candidatus Latescibacterota bacterium]
MRKWMFFLCVMFVNSGLCALAADLDWFEWKDHESISFGGFVPEMRAVKAIASKDGSDQRIVYGDRQGLIHVLRLQDGRFHEVWSSPALRSAISEIFVLDIDVDDVLEIVAYTEVGDVVFYRASDYQQIWRSTDDEFASISAMVVENVDEDPQLELVFCGEDAADIRGYRPPSGSRDNPEQERATQVGRLFVFDCKNLFVEWRSEQGLWGGSIAVGDLDDDGSPEIALNTGFVIDATYQRIDWEYRDGFGEKIGYADLDGDGIPELIGEFRSTTRPRRFIRIFDVDLQSESFLSSGR